MKTATATGIALLGIALLTLAVSPASALTEITVGPISAHLPDADGLFEGDSDCYIEVRVDGTLIGVTNTIDNNNDPNWTTVSFTYQYVPPSSPFLILSFKAYDVDGAGVEYLGEGLIAYNWVAGPPSTFTTSVNSTYGAGYTVTATYDANEVAVPVDSDTWGSIKALYR